KLQDFRPGSVLAVQIGNDEDWPSILVACLRRGVVILPLEQSISEQQRETALKICQASGVVENPDAIRKLDNEQLEWRGSSPTLLKLTSGTTAAPPASRFSSAQLFPACRQICYTKDISAADLNIRGISVLR